MIRPLLSALLLSPLLAFATPADTFTLSADQCVGGERRTEPDGSSVVFLPAAADINTKAEWTFPTPLPAGTYEVEIDVSAPSPLNNRLALEFSGANAISVDLTSFPRAQGLSKARFVISTLSPVTSLSAKKTAVSAQDSVGFFKLVCTPIQPNVLTNDYFFLWLPVVNGAVKIPFTLPGGMYRCEAPKGGTVTWKQSDGRTFTPPPGSDPVYLDGPGISLTVTPPDGKELNKVLLVHSNPTGAEIRVEGNPPLLTAVDRNKSEEGCLVLNGYQGANLPEIAVFPHGKRFAIVSSWDDGGDLDLMVAEKLRAHGFNGTFLMNRNSRMIPRLKELEALGAEIGSHTWSHPLLDRLTPQQCEKETTEMRRFLESQVGHPVISFAYPFNRTMAYDVQGEYIARSVANAGYLSARATTGGVTWIQSISPVITFNPDCHWFTTSPAVALEKFKTRATKDGLVFYFWGHSSELTKPEKATAFDALLSTLENQPDTWYATQGEVAIWSLLRKETAITPAPNSKNGKAFTFRRPWIHPYLHTVPLSVKLPEGVTSVTWNGTALAVQNGWVDLSL